MNPVTFLISIAAYSTLYDYMSKNFNHECCCTHAPPITLDLHSVSGIVGVKGDYS